ncbi:MAG: NAD(P)-binding protein [Deltaproteobacteria bacterium]
MKRRRTDVRTFVLYARTLLARFRLTIAALSLLVVVGGVAFMFTPVQALGGRAPSAYQSFYAAWMALIGQQVYSPPEAWYIAAVYAAYPMFGVVLVGEGIVRLGLLLFSREKGDSEWIKIMASTHRDHIVICGLGHLGGRIWQLLHARGDSVVLIEKDPEARFVAEARAAGVPVLVRDMKDDQALIDAGVAHAQTIIIASNDDTANLEVALDARRMNPKIRVLMRMFDQQLASKIKDAIGIDEAFSSAALAAPIVVGLLDAKRK